MWHKLQEDPPYLLLSKSKTNICEEVFITDLVSIWFVEFKKKELLKCLEDSNFGLEVESEELLQKGCNILNNPTDLRRLDVKKGVSSLELSMSKLFEYPLQLKLKLAEGSKEMFFQKVSYMLLKTVSDLKASQQELRSLLKKKDEEIEEYKCEGKEIALRYLKTKQFNDEEHMKQHRVHKESADLSNISMTVLEKIVATTDRNESIERATLKIKQEPEPATTTTPTESQSEPCLANVKREVKVDPHNSVSPRKKRKKLLNY